MANMTIITPPSRYGTKKPQSPGRTYPAIVAGTAVPRNEATKKVASLRVLGVPSASGSLMPATLSSCIVARMSRMVSTFMEFFVAASNAFVTFASLSFCSAASTPFPAVPRDLSDGGMPRSASISASSCFHMAAASCGVAGGSAASSFSTTLASSSTFIVGGAGFGSSSFGGVGVAGSGVPRRASRALMVSFLSPAPALLFSAEQFARTIFLRHRGRRRAGPLEGRK
mmetsp:Transcript_13899/g.31872  ORF Transcript_13899/g.31872 Transcript_13899/m.31872 type:complete len:227 (+) Transcript_13899:584-1264(+)